MNLSGNPFDYILAFLGGVSLSFTPCVYPLIPLTVSFIGIEAGTDKLKALSLSLVYVTGIAITYSILGLIASLGGKIFGTVGTGPIANILAGTIIIIFGLSMAELFSLPNLGIFRLPQLKKGDYLSTLILGLSSGLLVSPCITPVLGAILLYLAGRHNLLYGAGLLFSFAYGMGMVLILAGTFSSLLTWLPKSGRWLGYLKKTFAFILIVMGGYFVIRGIRRL